MARFQTRPAGVFHLRPLRHKSATRNVSAHLGARTPPPRMDSQSSPPGRQRFSRGQTKMRLLGRSKSRSNGFLLIDCLVYIGLLAVLLGLAFIAFYRVSDYSRHLSQNAADISRALYAGERWRKDVRTATGTPQLVQSGEGAVLHLP